MCLCPPYPPYLLHPLCIITWNMCAPVWHCVCITVTLILVPHLGRNVYMHQYMYLCLPDSPCLLHSISILTWKHGFLCVALCVYSRHSTSVPTPWLECVHASAHVFILLLVQHLGYTHTDLSNYRHVYLHHVKSGLHTINIRANKNTCYFFASQKGNDLQLKLRGLLGMEVPCPN